MTIINSTVLWTRSKPQLLFSTLLRFHTTEIITSVSTWLQLTEARITRWGFPRPRMPTQSADRWQSSAAHFTLQAIITLTDRQIIVLVCSRVISTSPSEVDHCAKKPVTTMLTYPWKCTVLHCNHLGNTWKPLVLMTRHFDYHPR